MSCFCVPLLMINYADVVNLDVFTVRNFDMDELMMF